MSKAIMKRPERRVDETALVFTDESLTKQEFEPECNINNILARFKVTGVLVDPNVKSLRQPMFIDCTNLPDLATYTERIKEARESFDTLPEEVREVFGDDPLAALQWFGRATDVQIRGLWKSLGLSPVAGNPIPSKQPEASVASIAAPNDEKGAA